MRRLLVPLVLLMLLAVAPAADAARRYAAPDGSDRSDRCAASDPCTIERAVNDADDGDEVIVAAGIYTLTAPLQGKAIDVLGDPDHAAPKIVAAAALKAVALRLEAGRLSHLELHSAVRDKEVVILDGGVADRIAVNASIYSGASIVASKAGTILRNSVIRTTGPGDVAALRLEDEGQDSRIQIRNVTVMAVNGSATGIDCEVKEGSASLVNTLVRGKRADIEAKQGCSAAFSNFRPDFASGLAPGAGNQSAEPLFADGDYRPRAGSPTIDAGALDAFASSPDPDGRPRVLGAAPDIGAYEYAPPATVHAPAGELPESVKGVPLPAQGRSVVVAAASGTIRVREPGAERFTVLDQPGRIPVGSLVDARHGRVHLVTAIAGGGVQAGLFWGSSFKTAQRRRGGGLTTLSLRGGRACASRGVMAVASRKRKRRRRRSLWARDNGGLYRTRGNDSVATAHGTAWLTRDRCRGTLTRVTEGAVSVRDLHRHKRVLVKAGHRYLARAAR